MQGASVAGGYFVGTSADATVLENVHFDVETEIAAWLAVAKTLRTGTVSLTGLTPNRNPYEVITRPARFGRPCSKVVEGCAKRQLVENSSRGGVRT